MRASLAALLVLGVVMAGCFGGGGGGKQEGPSATLTGTPTGADGKPVQASFTYAPANPRVGETVAFTAKVANLGELTVRSYDWTWGDGGKGSGATAQHAFDAAGAVQVRLEVTTSDGRAVRATRELFVLNAGDPVPGNGTQPGGAPPAVPGRFVCGGAEVVEANETFGTDDSLPAFAWLTLKTGSRFAVAWTSESATTGSLTYSIANQTPVTVTEAVPTRLHLIVVDGLAEGRTLCFQASMGGATTPLHAVRTVNAMTAFAPEAGRGLYTMNLLVVSNELGDAAEVAGGVAAYARRLWDATDGWVRTGAVLVVEADPSHSNAGWPCFFVAVPQACQNVFDVVVTNAAAPQGAASTYRQGIRDRDAAIWMNQYHQAMPGPLSLDDFGAVLLHEMGHYAFDMEDLYGDNTVVTTECYDSQTGISIMAGSRDATEFDDPVATCPNQPAGYTTSWEFLQGQFTQVASRPQGPVAGPEGDGGVFLARTYRAL